MTCNWTVGLTSQTPKWNSLDPIRLFCQQITLWSWPKRIPKCNANHHGCCKSIWRKTMRMSNKSFKFQYSKYQSCLSAILKKMIWTHTELSVLSAIWHSRRILIPYWIDISGSNAMLKDWSLMYLHWTLQPMAGADRQQKGLETISGKNCYSQKWAMCSCLM